MTACVGNGFHCLTGISNNIGEEKGIEILDGAASLAAAVISVEETEPFVYAHAQPARTFIQFSKNKDRSQNQIEGDSGAISLHYFMEDVQVFLNADQKRNVEEYQN